MVSRVNRRSKVNGKRTLIGVRVYRLPVGIRPTKETTTNDYRKRLPNEYRGEVKWCSAQTNTETGSFPALNRNNFCFLNQKVSVDQKTR